MNLTQKISQMTPKGADLDATDLIEVSTIVGGSYVTKSITGQELIDAIPLPPTGLTVGTTPIASGTIGRVLFQGTGNVLQQSGNLFWDGTNNRLGIGTSTPSYQLHVVGSAGFDNGASGDSITLLNGGFIQAGLIRFRGFSTNFILQDNSYNTKFAISTAGNLSYFNTGGNVAIGTTTDAGFKLDVNGTARVSAQLTATSVNSSSVGNVVTNQLMQPQGYSGEFRFTNGLGAGWFYTWVQNNGVERMRLSANNNLLINTTTDAGFRLDVNGTARVQDTLTVVKNQNLGTSLNITNTTSNFLAGAVLTLTSDASSGNAQLGKYSTTTTAYKTLSPKDVWIYNSSTGGDISILNDFATGQIKFAAGGSSTAHMTIKSNGRINMSALPTSSAGLSTGDIWNDAGTLKIV
jgi:hypothetical protein